MINLKRKIIEITSVFALICFSFFYTDKAVDIVRRNDPIMKEIKSVQKNYEIDATDAVIGETDMIPGLNGKTVNVNKSFERMKRYGKFNENLLVFEEVSPLVSIEEYYDRYIASGSSVKNSVALIFKVTANDDIDDIISILNERNIQATFFLDGIWIENNIQKVYELAKDNHELEVLSYDGTYNSVDFKNAQETLKNVINLDGKYCYAEYDQKEVLELCEKEQLHTIIPTILAKNYPYATIKTKLNKGSIIGMSINDKVKEELPTILNYINQKGYSMDTLDVLLNEANNVDK